MVVTQCRTCSTNIKEALTVQCSGRSGEPGDLDPPLPKAPRPLKISSAVSLLEMSFFKLCNVSVKKCEVIDCQDKIQKSETIIINASN